MESQIIRGISRLARKALCFDPLDENYNCRTRYAKLVNVFLVLYVLRTAYFLFGTRDEFWYFFLGHHFDAFGDAKMWSLMIALAATPRILVYVVVSRFSKSYPNGTQVV